jgi:hypothetical protein
VCAHVLRLGLTRFPDAIKQHKPKFIELFNKVVLAATSPLPAVAVSAALPLLPATVARYVS